MKKVLLFLFAFVFATDSFANDIAATTTNPVCDNATLEQFNGTANVEIDWEPNVIALRWYDGDTKLNVPVESQSCVYDGAMVIPPAPTKTGYTFKGWELRKTTCGIENLDTSINGTGNGQIRLDGTLSTNTGTYGLVERGQWGVSFSYGKIIGETICSSTNGTHLQTGTPNEQETGRWCWCRATGLISNDGELCSVYPKPLWVLFYEYKSYDACANDCAVACAYSVLAFIGYRTPLLESVDE